MKTITNKLIVLIIATIISGGVSAQPGNKVVVNVDSPKAEIQETMWGFFFEDINFAGDGGMYAEMVKNRSFEFPEPLMGWDQKRKMFFGVGDVLIINRDNEQANIRYAKVTVTKDGESPCLINEGFRGMGVKEGLAYNFSIDARLHEGSQIDIRVELVDEDETVLGSATLSSFNNEWRNYEVSLTANKTASKAKLNIWFEGEGEIDIDMISLFPSDTWMGRSKGLRADLVQMMADLNPGFFRFPGGCIVEGRYLCTRYRWKNTIGDIADRELIINRWNDENEHVAPDYYQTFGLGFFEYFQVSEDIGAEPMPIINCGMACQFNTAEVVALEELDPYVQDALDLIEFANGSADSEWGKVRAEMGHPEPFNMKYIGIGNENYGPQYIERYEIFEKAIAEKYPDMNIVASGSLGTYDQSGTEAMLKDYSPQLVDEHRYADPDYFFDNADVYDTYDRDHYKTFLGEYAVRGGGMMDSGEELNNTWKTALAEAAYMTGMERNADQVYMSSYAPSFAHVDAWQWNPNLIWFDNLDVYGTPNYYVQKMYSKNRGTHVLEILKDNSPLTGQNDFYATAAIDKDSNEIILKLVNASAEYKTEEITLETSSKLEKEAKVILLQNDDPTMKNSFNKEDNIEPVEQTISLKGKNITLSMEPYSFYVIRISKK